jgi:hypothetical protein
MRKSIVACLEKSLRNPMALHGGKREMPAMHGARRGSKHRSSLLLAVLCTFLCMTQTYGSTLSVILSGSGQGSVVSSPAGIDCPGSCSGTFTTFSLYSNPAINSLFSGWGGACVGMENCTLTLSSDKTVNAFFDLKSSPVRVSGSNYGAVQVAYDNIAPGGSVMVVARDQAGDLNLDKEIAFTLEGGFDDAFTSNAGTITKLRGSVNVREGSLAVEGLALAPSAPVPPSAPSSVTAVAGDGQVTISWGAVSGSTSYNVYYATAKGVTRANGTKVTGATSGQTVPSLSNNTTYYFVVTAVGANGESVESSQVMATPVPGTPAGPSAPSGVMATAGNGQVAVSWNIVSGATSYNVYWSTSPNVTKTNGTKIPALAAPPYQHTGRTNGTTYYYIVTANTASGESAPSVEVSAKPTALIGTKLVKMSVFNPEDGSMGYTTYEYNAAGLVSKVSSYGATGLLDSYVTTEYNPAGKVTKISNYIPDDMLMSYVTIEYNAEGKEIKTSSYIASSSPPLLASYVITEYNDAGKKSKVTTYNGFTNMKTGYTTYEYNAAGKVSKKSNYNFSDILTKYTTYEYNAAGDETRESNYDIANLLQDYTTTEYNADGLVTRITSYNGFTTLMTEYTTFGYDAAGNNVRISNYDFAGLLTDYITMEFDALGRPLKITNYGPTDLVVTYTTYEYGN